ncbi:MAG: Uma2 family endonuclease [Desulfobacterales bacterium]|nr:Uma2 family endonuclease [Desulfobacterales bacterium]
MPSLNHSYTCFQLMRQLMLNEHIYPLPELTLDIANGVTPDISVFPKEHINPNFFNDIIKFQQTPVLAIEVISPTQNIQTMLEKARMLVGEGVKAVWTVEPHGHNVFVITRDGEKLFHSEPVENEGVKVDFSDIFKT